MAAIPTDHTAALPSEDELRQMEERANAATEGPWLQRDGDQCIGNESKTFGGINVVATCNRSWDRRFIAHARMDVPRLIAAVHYLSAVSSPQRATIIPYTDEDDRPDPEMNGFVMLAIGPSGTPTHVLDRIPAAAAVVIADAINARLSSRPANGLSSRLRAAIHTESAAIAPHTTELIEVAREAADALESMAAELRQWRLSACFGCGCMDETKHTPGEFLRQWEAALKRESEAYHRAKAAEAEAAALRRRVEDYQSEVLFQILRAKNLEAQVERLTEALKPFAEAADDCSDGDSDAGIVTDGIFGLTIGDLRHARAALSPPDHPERPLSDLRMRPMGQVEQVAADDFPAVAPDVRVTAADLAWARTATDSEIEHLFGDCGRPDCAVCSGARAGDAEQPPADTLALARELAAWWIDNAPFQDKFAAAGLVRATAYELTPSGEAAINEQVRARAAGLIGDASAGTEVSGDVSSSGKPAFLIGKPGHCYDIDGNLWHLPGSCPYCAPGTAAIAEKKLADAAGAEG